MTIKLFTAALCSLLFLAGCQTPERTSEVADVSPTEAAERVAEGEAVLVDVREAHEWVETGVAAPAYLVPLSDLQGDRAQWNEFLRAMEGREILLYCRSGNRSGIAAAILAEEGVPVGNVGGFSDWQAADLPERSASEPRR